MFTQNKMRSLLRKLASQGLLQKRVTYLDFYDSCHPPIETPNAEWVDAVYITDGQTRFVGQGELHKRDLMKRDYGYSVKELDSSTWELSTGFSTFQLRIKPKG